MVVTLEHALADLDSGELATVAETFAGLVPWSLERGAPRRAVLYGAIGDACRAEQKRRARVLSEWAVELADDGTAGELVTAVEAAVEEAQRQLRDGDA